MTTLIDVLQTLDPAPGPAAYDAATVDLNVAAIVNGADRVAVARAASASATGSGADRPGSPPRWRGTRRRSGRPVSAGVVVVAVLALVATSVAVTQGWVRPLGGRTPATAPAAVLLFGPDIDPTTVRERIAGTAAAPLTLWSATSPALGTCLAVTAPDGTWSAADAPDAAWRPLSSGAACLDSRVGGDLFGTGLIAHFVDHATPAHEVFAGPVTVPEAPYVVELTPGVTTTTTPDSGPTSGVVRAVEVATDDGQTHPARPGDGIFITAPVPIGGCPTVVARNGAGSVLTSQVVASDCPGSPAPLPTVTSGSTAPDIHLNNNSYPDGLSSGLSALNRRDPALAAGDTTGMTVLTLSVQFFSSCQSEPGPAGLPTYPDPCMRTRVPIPTDIDLELTYGLGDTPAVRDDGRGGPLDDFTSPPTPGYVGGPVNGILVYRTFLVPDDQLGLLTARWAGDSQHAPLVMDRVQRALH